MTSEGIQWTKKKNDDGQVIWDVTYDIWTSQGRALEAFYDGDSQIVEFRGGYRSGKSVLGARAIIKGANKINRTRWLVVAESFTEGYNSTYKVLSQQFPECEGLDDIESSPVVKDYNDKKKRIKLWNGSVIVLGSAQKADRHKGDEFSGIWMDEGAWFNDVYDTLEMLLSRLSADRGPLKLLSTTTGEDFNEYHEIFELGEHPHKDKEISWSIETVTANTLENPFLSDEAKENLKKTHDGNEEQGLMGGFSSASGRVYDKFTRHNHVIKYDDIKDDLVDGWRLYGYDSGWDDPRVVIEIARTTENQLVVIDEFYQSESTIEDAINWLENKPTGIIYSEHDPEHIHKIRKKTNHIVKKAKKGIDDGIQSVKSRLETQNGMTGLVVCKRAENTYKEFLSYKKSEVGTSSAKDHSMDCIRYVVHTNKIKGGIPETDSDDEEEEVDMSSGINIVDSKGKNTMSERDNIRERRR